MHRSGMFGGGDAMHRPLLIYTRTVLNLFVPRQSDGKK